MSLLPVKVVKKTETKNSELYSPHHKSLLNHSKKNFKREYNTESNKVKVLKVKGVHYCKTFVIT